MQDKVRQTIIVSLAILHMVAAVQGITVMFIHYDVESLRAIRDMFSSTLTAIGAAMLILTGDRGVKNWTSPNQESKDKK